MSLESIPPTPPDSEKSPRQLSRRDLLKLGGSAIVAGAIPNTAVADGGAWPSDAWGGKDSISAKDSKELGKEYKLNNLRHLEVQKESEIAQLKERMAEVERMLQECQTEINQLGDVQGTKRDILIKKMGQLNRLLVEFRSGIHDEEEELNDIKRQLEQK